MAGYVRFNEVCKQYKMGAVEITASNHISFEIEKGEFAVIVGPSGAGKTTVLNILGGMDRADSGEVWVDDVDISKNTLRELTFYRRDDIGFVFQFYNLVPNLTALENVELATELKKDSYDPKEVLEMVGLGERLSNFPGALSGGEQQRVAIARALAKRPKLLLCDEPTGALDSESGKTVLRLLKESCEKTGTTVVVVTHNQAIKPMADRVIEINNSQVRSEIINPNPVEVADIDW